MTLRLVPSSVLRNLRVTTAFSMMVFALSLTAFTSIYNFAHAEDAAPSEVAAKASEKPAEKIAVQPLTVQLPSEPTQFDPLLLEDGMALKISANTIGTLFQYNGKGEREKALVDTYSVSRDHRHYIIKFKKGLKWSDGKAFAPEQFVLAVTRLTKEPVKVSLSTLFPKIDLKATRVLDSRTVDLALEDSDAQMLNWLTLAAFAPIREDIVKSYAEKRAPVVPTLGAYEVTDYKREQSLTLKKNENYFGADSVSIPEVTIRFVGDEAALVSLMKSGTIDVLNTVPVLQLKQVEEVGKVVSVPVEAITYLGFNTKKAPFSDVANRRLFRDALVAKKTELAQTLKTGELPASHFLPAILAVNGFKAVSTPDVKAPDSKLEFTIESDSGSRNQTILEFVQSEIKSKLHWKASLDMLDWIAHYAKLKSSPDEVYRFGWQNPVSDAYATYQVLTSDSPNNFTGWKNAKYDELVDDLRQENRNVKRSELIQSLEEILYEEAPVVPMLQQVLRFAVSKRVSGFRANSFGVILFRELHLSEPVSTSK